MSVLHVSSARCTHTFCVCFFFRVPTAHKSTQDASPYMPQNLCANVLSRVRARARPAGTFIKSHSFVSNLYCLAYLHSFAVTHTLLLRVYMDRFINTCTLEWAPKVVTRTLTKLTNVYQYVECAMNANSNAIADAIGRIEFIQ